MLFVFIPPLFGSRPPRQSSGAGGYKNQNELAEEAGAAAAAQADSTPGHPACFMGVFFFQCPGAVLLM